MIKFISQCIFSFITIPIDLIWLFVVLLIWVCFSLKENEEKFNNLPLPSEQGILLLTNILWKF